MKDNIIKFIKKNDEIAYRLKSAVIRLSMINKYFVNDRKFIEKQYKRRTGEKLDIDNPITYNEKLQWMKLFYKNPILNTCVDKYLVREYVQGKLGEENILIPLIGVYDNVDEINFGKLPDSFIMKLTNGSSFNHICYKKTDKEIEKIKAKFRKWIKLDYYSYGREWAYKNVKNRIVCEELLTPSSGNPPEDFRFFCFNGKVKVISVDIDSVVNGVKNSNYFRNLYTNEWKRIDATIQYPNKVGYDVPKPKRLEDMIRISEKLSEDFPAVRVDLYYFDEKIYFGELTFYHSSGYQKFSPSEFERELGSYIDIEKIKQDIINCSES